MKRSPTGDTTLRGFEVDAMPPNALNGEIRAGPPNGSVRRTLTVSPSVRSRCAEKQTGTLGPDPQANEMQGYRISFCWHCGAELKPQITRRGHPKRYCSDACRARAWRQGAARRRHRGSFEDSQDTFPELTGDRYAGDKIPDSVMAGEEVSLL